VDTSTGEIGRLTAEELAAILNREGRQALPGDRIDADRVVVSRRVAAKMRLANRIEKKHEFGRSRRRRTDARNRALGNPDPKLTPLEEL